MICTNCYNVTACGDVAAFLIIPKLSGMMKI
jgi:hypothetical protein